MINIEKRVEDALRKSAYQGLKIEFEPLKGEPFHITSLDIVEGSFKITKTSTSTNNMQIGNMSADDLSMELMNPYDSWGFGKFDDVYFCGATMRIKLLVYDQVKDEMAEVPFGVYIIDNQPRALDTVKITAFGNVIRLDIPFNASELPSLMNLYDLVSTGLEKAGLNYDDSIKVFPNNSIALLETAKIKSEQTITWRQVIKWSCECVGVNAISDENGVIKFVFYDKYTPDVLLTENDLNLETENGEILLIDDTPTKDFPLTPALRYADNGSEVAEEDVVITGFQFKVDDELYPEDAVMDYGLQSENNLVFWALIRRKGFAANVNEKLAGFTYRPFKCNILSFPHLQTYDSVTYVKDGKQYHSIITDIVYKLNGDMTLTAKGKNKEQKAWEIIGPLTPKQQAIIDSVSRKVDKTRDQLSSYENALLLFNEKMLHSMGLHKTAVNDPNGGIITYFHNMETLENSDTIYMFGAAGFAWTTDGWNDGDPVWHYGFTNTGDAILDKIHAYKLSADLIETGYLRSQNGASWINMDDGTFCFRSVKDKWMDIDTGEISYTYEEKLSLDESGELGVYGELRNLSYPKFSVFVGPSEAGPGAFTVNYDREGFGDLFQVYGAFNSLNGNKGAVWTTPFLARESGKKCVSVFWDEIALRNQENLGSALLFGSDAWVSVFRDNINISTSASHRHCWFNYYQPKYGYSPISYDFGNGAGGYANIVAGRIFSANTLSVGSVDSCYTNYKLSVYGDAIANNWIVNSDIRLKENIVQKNKDEALKKLCDMKFYSYDFKNSDVHIKYGTIAHEAPEEIQSEDGKGIDLYSYIGLTAKGVQELNLKIETQEEKIKVLEDKIKILEELIENMMHK